MKLFNWNKTIEICAGLPGSGKSTLALSLVDNDENRVIENDDYWYVPAKNANTMYGPLHVVPRGDQPLDVVERYENIVYRYEASMTHLAGAWCHAEAFRRLRLYPSVAVANTFVLRKHIFGYVEEARNLGVRIQLHKPTTPWADNMDECFKRNVHKVPYEVLCRMQRDREEITQDEINVLLGVPNGK